MIGEILLQFGHLLRHRVRVREMIDDVLCDLPEDRLDARLGLKVEQAELKHRLGLFLVLLRVMERLHPRAVVSLAVTPLRDL